MKQAVSLSYTAAEDAVIRKFYRNGGAKACEVHLPNRSHSSIVNRAAKLGIRSNVQLPPEYTAEEDAIIIEFYPIEGGVGCAKRLKGRRAAAIGARARRMGLRAPERIPGAADVGRKKCGACRRKKPLAFFTERSDGSGQLNARCQRCIEDADAARKERRRIAQEHTEKNLKTQQGRQQRKAQAMNPHLAALASRAERSAVNSKPERTGGEYRETVEEFLARGGRVERLPAGQMATAELIGSRQWPGSV